MARGVGDGNGGSFCGTRNLEQKLMLLWMQTGDEGCVLTELKKFAKFESKFCKRREQAIRMTVIRLHIDISYHDI